MISFTVATQELDDLYASLLQTCDLYLGFKLLPQAYPTWMTLTRAFYEASYVVVTANREWQSLGEMPTSEAIGPTLGTTADLRPFVLRWAPTLRGRVVDEAGAPVTDAFVYPKVGDSSVPLQGTSDSGWFSFDGLPEGLATLRVESESMVERTVTYDHRADAEPIEIVLQRGVRLEGRVLDSAGRPYDSTYVSVVDLAAPTDRGRMAWPSVEDDGTFAVQLLPGHYRLQANGERAAAIEDVEVRDPGPTRVTLRLPAR